MSPKQLRRDFDMRICLYLRLSKDRDGTATSISRQEADCQAYSTREGHQVTGIYRDSDFSAFDKKITRPDYERMLDQVQKGEVDAILVWKLDRLSRQPGQFEKVIDTCQATGTKILSCNDP